MYESLKVDTRSVVSKQKYIDYIQKQPSMVIFLYLSTHLGLLYQKQNVKII